MLQWIRSSCAVLAPLVLALGSLLSCSDRPDVTVLFGPHAGAHSADFLAPRNAGGDNSDQESTVALDAGAQTKPIDSGFMKPWAQQALEAHNAIRRGAQADIQPLIWSGELAAFAQQWADTVIGHCDELLVRHRPDNVFGENLTARSSFGARLALDPASVVEGWASERACWTPGAYLTGDACNTECVNALHSSSCGHYTQLVWRQSTSVGCGYASCIAGRAFNEILVCNYAPAGNIPGHYPY